MVKALFFGTPQIAVPYLEWLIEHTTVVGVVCRPDEPVGRGYKLTAPPTKVAAEAKKIPVFQPTGPWTDATISSLKNLGADIGIVVAYGRLMPRPLFESTRWGCVNIHFSLLPKYRGAAPMQWSLVNGETKTGVSAFWIEEGLDSGPIFFQSEMPIDPNDRTPELREKLVPLGIEVLANVIKSAENGKLIRDPQKGEPTLAPLLKKEMGQLVWREPAQKIVNLVRGLCEWPGVSTSFPMGGVAKKIKILRARVAPERGMKEPGTILEAVHQKGILVQAGDGTVQLAEVQPEGKKAMDAWAFWQGAHLKMGDKLG